MVAAPQPPELAVVFPAAGPAGGVERVAAELLRFESARRTTAFVGTTLAAGVADAGHPVQHRRVSPRGVPAAFRPLAFRRAAVPVVRSTAADTTVSFGVECPPGDVLWVHSVHAAWLDRGTPALVRGGAVPAGFRRLLARHQVLLGLERRYFRRSSPRALLCTSQQEVDDLAEHYGVDPALMHVVPNGFDAGSFDVRRREALRGPLRQRIGATEDDIVVLMVANEWHRKGLATLLDAVAATGNPRLRVDLVGRRAPIGYDAQAARLGLGDRFHWHGPSDDVAPWYAAADVFALPTAYEPFGIVIVEAMAMGLPVVVPALAGAPAWITSGVDGLVVDDPQDTDALTEALRLLGDADVRHRIGSAAPAAVAALSWDQVLESADARLFSSGTSSD